MMSVFVSLLFYSSLMAILSFIAGLPPFWILAKSQIALPYLITLTSGLLLSTCLNIVLPEAVCYLTEKSLNPSLFGPQILFGFVFLYSIDVIASNFSMTFNDHLNEASLDNEEITLNNTYSIPENLFNLSAIKYNFISVISNSTTLGLIFHCLTDGIILTTSLLSENSLSNGSNAFVIILAIFLHKLPASFSLTSILLNQNLKNSMILFHLFLFSIAAPIGAWLAFVLFQIFNLNHNEASNLFIMLFSAGAFLYVSFHTFLSCHNHDSDENKNESSHLSISNYKFLITVVGMVIPLIVAFLHDD